MESEDVQPVPSEGKAWWYLLAYVLTVMNLAACVGAALLLYDACDDFFKKPRWNPLALIVLQYRNMWAAWLVVAEMALVPATIHFVRFAGKVPVSRRALTAILCALSVLLTITAFVVAIAPR